ncbi:hypothetical protein GCM10022281_16820 [Sphingomonas rosea]|uniref:EF-hand domain-containing protein n=1 Tax=Sphingomonas rosea TaxID=335605 RepID=A0ABP7U6H3_9SPHN
MATTPAPLSDEQQQRIASLTAKERECLRGWLDHRTAKELAIEHGISHHAVEKRLKSARDRLGVATSIEAARLLEAFERYGRPASGPPELSSFPSSGQQEASAGVAGSAPKRRRIAFILMGVCLMTLCLFALLLSAGVSLDAGAAATQSVTTIDKRTAPPGALDAAFDAAFRNLDKDGSGFLEGKELSEGKLRVARTMPGKNGTSPTQAINLSDWNRNGDNRLSPEEFRVGMNGLAGQLR